MQHDPATHRPDPRGSQAHVHSHLPPGALLARRAVARDQAELEGVKMLETSKECEAVREMELKSALRSIVRIAFYHGYPPMDVDDPLRPENRLISEVEFSHGSVTLEGNRIFCEHEPPWPEGVTFSRFYDDAGNTVIQSEL